jgi:hypothetical protein
MITFQCGTCSKQINVADASAGKRGRCPQCKAAVQVPAPMATTTDRYNCSICGGMFPLERVYDIEGSVVCTTCHDRQQQDALYDLAQSEPEFASPSIQYKRPGPSTTEGIRDVMMPRKRGAKTAINWPLRIVVALVCGAAAVGLYVIANGMKVPGSAGKPSASSGTNAADDSLAKELEAAARERVPKMARAYEAGTAKAKDFLAGKPEGTTKVGELTINYIKFEARRLDAERDHDAAGFVTYEVVRGDGTTERKTDEMRRGRADGVWKYYTDPSTVARVAPVAAPDPATTNKSFEKFARGFVSKIAPALNEDATFRQYTKFELTRNESFSVDAAGGSVLGHLLFDAGSVKGFVTDSNVAFNATFELHDGRWQFANGRWRWSRDGDWATMNSTTASVFRRIAQGALR